MEFEFDLPDALLNSLIKVFDDMLGAPLVASNVLEIPEEQGVYQLLLRGQVVYVGKTDADYGLRGRLAKHAWTIQHRLNLSPSDVLFKAARIFVFTAMDLEKLLIRHYSERSAVWWNNSGFGSNDPGRNRDDTDLKPTGFDAVYPIDLDQPVDIALEGALSVAELLAVLRAELPYTLRAQGAPDGRKSPHPDLTGTLITEMATAPGTTRQVLQLALSRLPAGWQATALAGRVILYKEAREYRTGTVIGRSTRDAF
ncbi:GIY-YIG nuclease family protein [Rhizobium leguminosarum]|nr:GIY-YIG nuclease family protein [Rhizobium leguminosarum]